MNEDLQKLYKEYSHYLDCISGKSKDKLLNDLGILSQMLIIKSQIILIEKLTQ